MCDFPKDVKALGAAQFQLQFTAAHCLRDGNTPRVKSTRDRIGVGPKEPVVPGLHSIRLSEICFQDVQHVAEAFHVKVPRLHGKRFMASVVGL